jgi:hypothetical protein
MEQERDLITVMMSAYRDDLPDGDQKTEATAALAKLATSSLPIKGVFYSSPIDLKDVVVNAQISQNYAEMAPVVSLPTTIHGETFRGTVTYGALELALKKRISTDLIVHFDPTSGEVHKEWTDDEKTQIGYRAASTLVFKANISDGAIVSLVSILRNGDAITEDQARRDIAAGAAVKLTDATDEVVTNLDMLADFLFGTSIWSNVEATVVQEFARDLREYVYDSDHLTVDGYPDVLALNERFRGQALMAFVGKPNRVVDQFFRMSMLFTPQDSDFDF